MQRWFGRAISLAICLMVFSGCYAAPRRRHALSPRTDRHDQHSLRERLLAALPRELRLLQRWQALGLLPARRVLQRR